MLTGSKLLIALSAVYCSESFTVPHSNHVFTGINRECSSSKNHFFMRGDVTLNLLVKEETIEKVDDTTKSKEFATIEYDNGQSSSSFSYGDFAKQYPFVNNIAIATTKTAAADLLAQTVIGGTPLLEIDVQRSALFMLFGALYLGGFQYLYQVQVFKKLFNIEKFTNLSWKEKLEDKEGLKALGLQTALDLTVLTVVYLPTFYIFKAAVFSGSPDPNHWASVGFDNYVSNFAKDEADLLKVWFPADLVCFSVPLYLRLPVRHIVSFVWTAYLSFARGGH